MRIRWLVWRVRRRAKVKSLYSAGRCIRAYLDDLCVGVYCDGKRVV